jgi:hypothetical protein
MPDMIEENDPVVVLESRGDEAPHVLVTAIAVSEDHGLLASPENLDIVTLENGRHGHSVQAKD